MSATAIESPIKWMGGKKKLSRVIAKLLPPDAECYGEAFAGAAWVLFAKKPHPIEAINDKNDHLANLWRVFKWRKAELLEAVQSSLYSRTLFNDLKATDPVHLSELERAAWLYLLIQMSFGSDLSSIRSASFGYRNKCRSDLFLSQSLERFPPASDRLRNVFIENLDFEDFIGRYDQPRSVFFCDPPYFGTCGYEESFAPEDHERLANCLRRIEGRFLLTVNDCPETRRLYSAPNWRVEGAMEPRGKSRAASGRQAAPILFVSNYPLKSLSLFPLDEEEDEEEEAI